MISLEGVNKKYGNKTVLEVDKLSFERGKIYGIIGPNGAGKSTLLKVIAGMEKASSGTLKIEGKENTSSSREKITYSNQKPYMYKTTVYNNLMKPLKFRKFKKEERVGYVQSIMEKFNIENLKEQKAVKLSGGEIQKVALARALIFNPEYILLDEPTANIDPEYVEFMERKLVQEREERGATIIIITHNINQAKRICDKVIYMEKGRIEEFSDKKMFFSESGSTRKIEFIKSRRDDF